MDSVRYFEFDFAWPHAAKLRRGGRYLDASSPRLFPLTVLSARPDIRADLANPHAPDLDETRALAAAARLADRCTFHDRTIDQLDLPELTFDLVTSISVVEHIPSPGDARAITRLWSLVRPGGRLIVTVPVAREGVDEYVDVDEYGLVPTSSDGWTFGQHLYDAETLRSVFAAAGKATDLEVYGERQSGMFLADRDAKTSGQARAWREPLQVSHDYRRFPSVDALPGWGVAGLVFVKEPASGAAQPRPAPHD